jgi:group I intron endonuclease
MGVIYKITSPSGRLYVGKTHDLRKRINAYKCDIRKNRKDLKLHNSLRKYGWDAHILEVIEEVDDILLDEREIYWIAELNTYCYKNPKGLNMTLGGDGQRSTWMHDIERRKKQSKVFSGEGNPFYGKRHTEEVKKHLSEKAKEWCLKNGKKVPKWGAEKGRQRVIKPVLMYNAFGIFIKEFESCTEAANYVKGTVGDVSKCAAGERTHARGYVFRYKTENYPLKIEVKVKQQTVKRPIITELFGKIWEHPSAQEASEYFSIPKTTINRAAMYNNGKPIRAGHKFFYKDQKQNRPHIVGHAA